VWLSRASVSFSLGQLKYIGLNVCSIKERKTLRRDKDNRKIKKKKEKVAKNLK